MRIPRSRQALYAALLGVVICAAAIVTVKASIPSSTGTLSTCVATTARQFNPPFTFDLKGNMRAIDVEKGESCGANEQLVEVNVQQPPGLMWVIMNGDGTILRHSEGVVEACPPVTCGRTNTGLYQVLFDRPITSCAPVATVTFIDLGVGSIPPLIPVVVRPSDVQFGIAIFKPDGSTFDSQFSLVVAC